MRDYLKTYQIKLKVIGPLFIGSGNSINKKEYILDRDKNKVYIPNINKMYTWFFKNNFQDKFDDYMLSEKSVDFMTWLGINKISPNVWKEWTDYILDCSETSDIIKGKETEISTFIKDSFGDVYIPGSSLKGALRTIILGSEILKNNSNFNKYKSDVQKAEFKHKNSYLKKEMKIIEQSVFNKAEKDKKRIVNMVNDIMAGIRIRDSRPILTDNLILCSKIDETPKWNINKVQLLRECITPDTEIIFDMTVDTTIFKENNIKHYIMEAINTFGKNYMKCFNNKFKSGDKLDGTMFYMGGGSGFVSKTITYPLLGENAVKTVSEIIDKTLSKKNKDKHKHNKDFLMGVSPHMIKKTKYNKKIYSFGLCSIDIVEVNI